MENELLASPLDPLVFEFPPIPEGFGQVTDRSFSDVITKTALAESIQKEKDFDGESDSDIYLQLFRSYKAGTNAKNFFEKICTWIDLTKFSPQTRDGLTKEQAYLIRLLYDQSKICGSIQRFKIIDLLLNPASFGNCSTEIVEDSLAPEYMCETLKQRGFPDYTDLEHAEKMEIAGFIRHHKRNPDFIKSYCNTVPHRNASEVFNGELLGNLKSEISKKLRAEDVEVITQSVISISESWRRTLVNLQHLVYELPLEEVKTMTIKEQLIKLEQKYPSIPMHDNQTGEMPSLCSAAYLKLIQYESLCEINTFDDIQYNISKREIPPLSPYQIETIKKLIVNLLEEPNRRFQVTPTLALNQDPITQIRSHSKAGEDYECVLKLLSGIMIKTGNLKDVIQDYISLFSAICFNRQFNHNDKKQFQTTETRLYNIINYVREYQQIFLTAIPLSDIIACVLEVRNPLNTEKVNLKTWHGQQSSEKRKPFTTATDGDYNEESPENYETSAIDREVWKEIVTQRLRAMFGHLDHYREYLTISHTVYKILRKILMSPDIKTMQEFHSDCVLELQYNLIHFLIYR